MAGLVESVEVVSKSVEDEVEEFSQPHREGPPHDLRCKNGVQINELHVQVFDDRLHNARNSKEICNLLSKGSTVDVNAIDGNGDTPLHNYIGRGDRGYDCLLALLTHSYPSMATNKDGLTPLHLAVDINNIDAVKALIAFGADVDAVNSYNQTVLDIALEHEGDPLYEEMITLVVCVGCELGHILEQCLPLPEAPQEFSQSFNCSSLSFSYRARDSFTVSMEQRRRRKHRELKHAPPVFQTKSGQRVLCLDGGGMRGLIQLEVLRQITESTGQSISELFQWVVGTSTGAIVALALVYGGYDIAHLRNMYFEVKDKVFGTTGDGTAFNTEALEIILKDALQDKEMTALENGPKMLISAVDKSTDKLKLVWFNNCFHDEYYGKKVWEVARCTSAAPSLFKPMDLDIKGRTVQFVDGGLRASNPSEDSLSIIQRYLDEREMKVSMVISVGCGVYPDRTLGAIDAGKISDLFFGKKFFKFGDYYKKSKNLIIMLKNAMDNSEQAATNTESRCHGQHIPFYRFSPNFDRKFALGETDSKVLCTKIVEARKYITTRTTDIDEIVQFLLYSRIQRDMPLTEYM